TGRCGGSAGLGGGGRGVLPQAATSASANQRIQFASIAYVYEGSYVLAMWGDAIDSTWPTTQSLIGLSSKSLRMPLTLVAVPACEITISSAPLPCEVFFASPASTAVARQREMIICLRWSSCWTSSIFSGEIILPPWSCATGWPSSSPPVGVV